jgi:hypothetical protein
MRFLTRCFWAILSPIFLLPVVVRSQDNPRPSHTFDDNEKPPQNIAKLLEARRHRRPAMDPKFMQEMLQRLQKDFDPNQIDPETIRKLLENNPELRDPNNLQQLGDLVKQQMNGKGLGQFGPQNDNAPNIDWQKLKVAFDKLNEHQKQQKLDPKVAIEPPAPPKVDVPPKDDTPPKPKTDKDSQELTKWFAKNLGNSSAFKDLAKELHNIAESDKDSGLLKDIEKDWNSLFGSSKADDKILGNLKMGDWKFDLKLPDLSSGSGGSSSGSGGGSLGLGSSSSSDWSPPSAGGFGGSWSTFVIIGLIVVAGVMVWLLYVRSPKQPEVVADAKPPWPVSPSEVKTREDVVKAFEYLSVSKCGDDAINWHHHQIAQRIGGDEPDRREAAARLAHLYEKARYTPLNELFSEIELEEARARLKQLEGVPAA